MTRIELILFVVPAGESEQYLLSDDSEDESDNKLDTVEEGQEEGSSGEDASSSESNANNEGGEGSEEAEDGGGSSIPEEAPAADPEPPASEDAKEEPAVRNPTSDHPAPGRWEIFVFERNVR